jgi:hypothetical protein
MYHKAYGIGSIVPALAKTAMTGHPAKIDAVKFITAR